MHVALHDADNTRFHNLALMKLSTWHKAKGDTVARYLPLCVDEYDIVYASKVFCFTKDDTFLPEHTIKGGTGYNIETKLDDVIEHTCPDYNLYNLPYSLGFLTRGCIRDCPWCIVPKKEGKIRAHADIEEFLRHRDVILMDNNVLAHDHGINQLSKIAKLGLRVDFNQGLDARLIDGDIAKRLASLKWLKPIRLACDRKSQMPTVEKAVKRLRSAGATPSRFFCYVLVQDVQDALERVLFLESLGVRPFAQPYRDFAQENYTPTREQRSFSRWCNMRAVSSSCSWEDYLKKQIPTDQHSLIITP